MPDRSGKDGIGAEQLEAFYANCEDYSNWHLKAESNKEAILPYGESTEEAFSTFTALKTKIDDYFLRCQLAEFDPVSADTLNSLTARFELISAKDLSTCMDEIAGFPIAKIEAKKPLLFNNGINPAWKDLLAKFKQLVYTSANVQKNELTEKDWAEFQDKFNDYSKWKSEKAGAAVEALGLDEIRAILSSSKKEEIISLIEQDKNVGK